MYKIFHKYQIRTAFLYKTLFRKTFKTVIIFQRWNEHNNFRVVYTLNANQIRRRKICSCTSEAITSCQHHKSWLRKVHSKFLMVKYGKEREPYKNVQLPN